MKPPLIRIGFWRSNGAPGSDFLAGDSLEGLPQKVLEVVLRMGLAMSEASLPSPLDFVDPKWNSIERETVIRYIKNPKFKSMGYMGHSTCRICGRDNGSFDFTDGKYIWPEGYAHYLRDHAVRAPAGFVKHILKARVTR